MKRIIGFSLTAATLALTVAACQGSNEATVTPGDSTIARPSTTLAPATTTIVTLPPASTQASTTTLPATTTQASTTTAKPKTPATTAAPTTTVKVAVNNDALFAKVFADLQTADQKLVASLDLVAFDGAYGAIKRKYASSGVKLGLDSVESGAFKYIVTISGTTKCQTHDTTHAVPVLVSISC